MPQSMPEEDTRDIRVTLSLDDHTRLIVQAALARIPMRDYAANAIMQKVDEDEVSRAKIAASEMRARIAAEEAQG